MKKLLRQIRKKVNILIKVDPDHKIQKEIKYIKLGNDGADWAVAPNLNKDSIVYSFGIGEDISFDMQLIKKYNLSVFAFDPTTRSLEWLKKQKLPRNFKVYPWGLADVDGKVRFAAPTNPKHVSYRVVNGDNPTETTKFQVYTLGSIMKKLRHKKIDLLKMDIEGSEYPVITDILKSKIEINQLSIEFHHRFPEHSKEDTEVSIRMLNKSGYKIFYISDVGQEYSLIR